MVLPAAAQQEERSLKRAYAGILFIAIITAVVACGCASLPAPPVSTVKPADMRAGSNPTALPEGLRASTLFDTGKLSWFEYRLTGIGGASDIRFDYTTAVIGGVTFKDNRITLKMQVPDMVMVRDSYYDPATGKQVGSRQKVTSAGNGLTDQEIGNRYQSSNIVEACLDHDWPMSDAGAEVITAGGNSYSCTRYIAGDAGEEVTAWVAREVPVPVKIESKAAGGTLTWELSGWG